MNMEKYSFEKLLEEQHKLRIPKIQRDYAQGRTIKKVNEIRKSFVHTLMLVVKGKQPSTELDFIYGSTRQKAFEPLDGQQRLTTLFLLHWMMGVDLSIGDDKKHSVFTYETRNTSQEFCNELVQHKAIQYIIEANEKFAKPGKWSSPSMIIKNRDWFRWEWKYDPTVSSMLVMIDAIYDEIARELEKEVINCDNKNDIIASLLKGWRANLGNITFNRLNLGEFGLSDELFVKMNARGKQLSEFDKLKSTLEEELQLQKREKYSSGETLSNDMDEKDWRTLMDGPWIDFFWHKYVRPKNQNTDPGPDKAGQTLLPDASLCESQFKNLLLRLIALQFFEKDPSFESPLQKTAYDINAYNLDNLLTTYTDSLVDLRSDADEEPFFDGCIILNFRRLMDDVNLLLYKDCGDVFRDISSLLSQNTHVNKDGDTLFDSFLKEYVPNDVEFLFYVMLLFLREFAPAKTECECGFLLRFDSGEHLSWIKNLEDWVRSLRNILLNVNNNARIDKIWIAKEVVKNLNEITSDLTEYVRENHLDMENDETVVLQFLKSLGEKTYLRLDNQSLKEEIEKATLKSSDKNWGKLINTFETHEYLWGQIRCLINWSGKDLQMFEDYGNRLINLLDFIKDNPQNYYAAILSFRPKYLQSNSRLFEFNNDRDNSFKRHLRDYSKDNETIYGATLKAFIDCWREEYSRLGIGEYIEKWIEKGKGIGETWVECVAKSPHIIDWARNKMIFEERGHVILAMFKTKSSHCFDPILIYLNEICGEIDERELNDSVADDPYSFRITLGGSKYFVQWDNEEYAVSENDGQPVHFTAKGLVEYIGNKLSMASNVDTVSKSVSEMK